MISAVHPSLLSVWNQNLEAVRRAAALSPAGCVV